MRSRSSSSKSTIRRSRRGHLSGQRSPANKWYSILDWGRIDDGGWKLRPSGIGIKKPLQVGKEWRSDANAMNLQSGIAFRASGAAKVVVQEKVTTPAGTFDTFRIDTTVTTGQHEGSNQISKLDLRVLVCAGNQPMGKEEAEWRQEGRVRDSFIEELTGYSRKP